MSVRKGFIVTNGFQNVAVGSLEIDTDFTDIALMQCVLAPAYVEKEDGTVELTEFSIIPATHAVGLISRGIEHGKEQNTQA